MRRRALRSACISGFLILLCGCQTSENSDTGTANAHKPQQYIVLLDLSLSRTRDTQQQGLQFLDQLTARFGFGDRITVLQVQEEGLKDQAKHWTDNMPILSDPTFVNAHDRKLLAAEQESVREAVKVLSVLPPGVRLLHTDLFTTLNLAAEYAHDYSSKPTTVILMSDMLQSANGIEMDRAQRMPPLTWIARQNELGLIPKFPGACILVIGANGTTPDGAKVRNFWQKYFDATGAHLPPENFRATPPADGSPSCP